MAKKVTKKTEGIKKKATRAKRTSSRAKTSPVEAAPAAPSLDAIRARAYEIYASGRNPGDPVADWFEAEQELSNASP